MKQLYYIPLWIIFLAGTLWSSNGDITVHDDFSSIEISPKSRVLLDSKGSLTHRQIIESDRLFRKPDREVPSFGYTDDVIWIRFTLVNESPDAREALLEIKNPIMDEVTFHDPARHRGGPVIAGDMVPFESRDVGYRNPVFRLSIPAGATDYYLRIRTTSNSNVPMTLWDPDAFEKKSDRETIVLWLFYGLMLALMLYNLIIYLFIRERDYLYYVLYILGFIVFRLAYNGLAYQHLWPGRVWWANVSVPFTVAFLALFLVLFSRRFLRMWDGPKAFDFTARGLAAFFALCLPFSLFAPYRYSIQIILGVSVIAVFLLLLAGIFGLRWIRRQAVFYLIAWSIFLIGSFLNIARDFGVLPHTFITAWGQQIGSAMQVLLLSIGLADRINIMRHAISESNIELIRANRNLLDEREQMSAILRSISDGVITCSSTGEIRYVSHSMEKLLRTSRRELEGKKVTEVIQLFDPDDQGRNITENLLAASGISVTNEAVLNIDQDDSRDIEYTVSPLKDHESVNRGLLLVFRDLTERKRLEREMIKKNKLDAMGTLAAGIAHDFNNILTGLTGNIGMALMSCGDDQEVKNLLEEAERISYKARNLTQQFLAFSREVTPMRRTISIDRLIREIVTFTLSGTRISAVFSIPDDLRTVSVDEGQISQVLNNIVLNAVEAMPDGGEIEISADNTEKKTHPDKTENYVMVTVRDRGEGIPPDVMPHIFDPFYTTKEYGSGLGLSSCYFIVEQHGGFIDVDSSPGKGTAFSVYLPTADIQHEQVSKEERQGDPVRGNERVLVMDDEDMILRTTGSILERLGYEVLLAENGTRAIEIFREENDRGGTPDAVILDLTVPGGMGGKDTLLELRKIQPGIRAIASSGYSKDPIMTDFKKYGFTDILIKPYTVELLSQVLRHVLKKT